MITEQALAAALQHHRAGRVAQAEAAYRQILATQGDQFDALHNLGLICAATGRHGEAAELIKAATQLRPDNFEAHSNLGNVYCGMARFRDAEAAFQQALLLSPGNAGIQNNLATVLGQLNRFDEALAMLQAAIATNPNSPEMRANLGNVLHRLDRYDEALEAYRQALELRPDFPAVKLNIAVTHFSKGEIDAAIDGFRQVLRTSPNSLEARKYLANSLRLTASHDESIACYDQVLAADPANSAVASARIFSMQFHDGYDAPRILAEYSRWADRYARPLSLNTPPHPNDPSPDRRLRVGFVSPDFRRHCQALFIEPLFSHHDRRQIELFCYASVSKPDSVTQRLQTHADTWRDCREMADSALAAQIRDDKIDILIDLTMHMPLGRPLLFARKPAPVQVAYLAYPGTTGMTAIDYRITDPYLDPPGQHDDWYTEQTVRLPETFWCYDPWGMEADRSATAQPLPDPGPLPLQANGYVTFGCLNDFCKMNLPTLALWARVLRAVDRSRLLMLAPKGSTRQKVVQELARHGIEENRLDFVALQPRRKRSLPMVTPPASMPIGWAARS
jgi:predicted O-linked N-acetylglucosamine transferase (SPINDLY family)